MRAILELTEPLWVPVRALVVSLFGAYVAYDWFDGGGVPSLAVAAAS